MALLKNVDLSECVIVYTSNNSLTTQERISHLKSHFNIYFKPALSWEPSSKETEMAVLFSTF